MKKPDGFSPARDQDAYFVLRGFRYQIDLTIVRWSSLSANEFLELECGEDIDLVAEALKDESEAAYSRKLEQVKALSKRVTLRFPEIRRFLHNAYEHRLANPENDLSFLFTTNATATFERPRAFGKDAKGLEVWNRARKRLLAEMTANWQVNQLQKFMVGLSAPPKTKSNSWNAFIDFWKQSSNDDLAEFIASISFGCGASQPRDVKSEILSCLIENDFADDETSAKDVHRRLFLFVLDVLCEKGVKRLTKQQFEAQVAAGLPSGIQAKVLSRIEGRFESLDRRMEDVENAVGRLSVDVKDLVEKSGFEEIQNRPEVISSPPHLTSRLAKRTSTVKKQLKVWAESNWLAFHGAVETGKSHLVVLLSDKLEFSGWIRFRHDMPVAEALKVFEHSIREIAKQNGIRQSNDFVSLVEQTQPNSCFILEDVPRIGNQDRLTERLLKFAVACKTQGVKLISTSQFTLPSRLSNESSVLNLTERPAPRFDESDAKELFEAFAAPDNLLDASNMEFIVGVTHGHPFLLVLVARFLEQQDWKWSEEQIGGLLSGQHRKPVEEEIYARLLNSLTDSERELLYRLSLASSPLSNETAVELATVEKAITRPKECISSLTGTWVQRESASTIESTPLVEGFGNENLAVETAQQSHLIIGTSITRKKMSPWSSKLATFHFLKANQFDLVGILHIQLLEQMRVWNCPIELKDLAESWSHNPLPEQMDLGLRIKIRALQFWQLPRFGIDDEFVLERLDVLVARAGHEQLFSLKVTASLAMLFLSERDLSRALLYFNKLATLLASQPEDVKALYPDEDFMLPRGQTHEELLWTPIANISTPSECQEWMQAFDSLNEQQKWLVMESKEALLGADVLAGTLLLVEQDKSPEQQNWDRTIDAVTKLKNWAKNLGWNYLHACALKALVNIHGEFLKDVSAIRDEVVDFTNDDSFDSTCRSKVAGMYGKALTMMNEDAEACKWLKKAIDLPSNVEGHDRMMTCLAAAKSFSGKDKQLSVHYSSLATDISQANPNLDGIEAVKAFGEHAIAVVRLTSDAKSAIAAFPSWNQAVETIMAVKVRNFQWRDIFVLFAHVQSYLMNLAIYGLPPETASDGSQYAAPWQGMFFSSNPQRESLFDAASIASIMQLHAHYAKAAGNEQQADYWFDRAVDEIADEPNTFSTVTIRQEIVPGLIAKDRFAEAVDAAYLGCKSMVAARNRSKRGSAIPHGMPIEDVIAGMQGEHQQLAERFAVETGLVPAMLRLLWISTTDHELAINYARELESVCCQIATTAFDPKLWLSAAEIFHMVIDESSVAELIKFGNLRGKESNTELKTLAYLGCTLVGDASDVYVALLAQVRQLFATFPADSRTHQTIILPAVEAYWRNAIVASRFCFKSPDVVEPKLMKAFNSKTKVRVRKIFNAIESAFPHPGSSFSHVFKWLRDPNVDEPEKLPKDLKKLKHETSAQLSNDKRSRIKVGRNDPCPCGSGKKYKRCCLKR